MTPERWNKLKAKAAAKPNRSGKVQGNEAWRALSNRDRLRDKHEPEKLRLGPMDVFGSKGKAHRRE